MVASPLQHARVEKIELVKPLYDHPMGLKEQLTFKKSMCVYVLGSFYLFLACKFNVAASGVIVYENNINCLAQKLSGEVRETKTPFSICCWGL